MYDHFFISLDIRRSFRSDTSGIPLCFLANFDAILIIYYFSP